MSRLALVTNDDGIDSPGLHALARAALRSGLRVVVAAPAAEASGSSAALNAVERDGRIDMDRRSIAGLEDVEAYALPAAPAFITLLAHRGAFGDPPDVVLSGINRGANTGSLILHSGTVGAALTAATEGCRSLAVSLCSRSARHWETAEAVAEIAIGLLERVEPGVALSVNVPDLPLAELRGLTQARLAEGGAVQTAVAEVGDDFLRLGSVEERPAPAPGTDIALIAAGHATLTALRPLCEVELAGVDLRAAFPPAPPVAAAAVRVAPAPRPDAPPGR